MSKRAADYYLVWCTETGHDCGEGCLLWPKQAREFAEAHHWQALPDAQKIREIARELTRAIQDAMHDGHSLAQEHRVIEAAALAILHDHLEVRTQ